MSEYTVCDCAEGFVPEEETAESLTKDIIIERLKTLRDTLECGSGNDFVYGSAEECRSYNGTARKVRVKLALAVEIEEM